MKILTIGLSETSPKSEAERILVESGTGGGWLGEQRCRTRTAGSSPQAAREVAGAALEQGKAELENAKADADRAKQFRSGAVARQDYETKLTNFRVIQAQVALANAQAKQTAAELREFNSTRQRGAARVAHPWDRFHSPRTRSSYVSRERIVVHWEPLTRISAGRGREL